MASEVRRALVIGNFKTPLADRLGSKKRASRKRRAERPGNSEEHLAAVRKLPCIVCGTDKAPVRAHHLRSTREGGAGQKPPDKWTVPLCDDHHNMGVDCVHGVGSKKELGWFARHGIDALALAAALWSASPNVEAMKRVWLANWVRKSK